MTTKNIAKFRQYQQAVLKVKNLAEQLNLDVEINTWDLDNDNPEGINDLVQDITETFDSPVSAPVQNNIYYNLTSTGVRTARGPYVVEERLLKRIVVSAGSAQDQLAKTLPKETQGSYDRRKWSLGRRENLLNDSAVCVSDESLHRIAGNSLSIERILL
jgi:hypothetical protein